MKILNFIIAIVTGVIFYLFDEGISMWIRIAYGIAAAQGGYIGANVGDYIRRISIPDMIFYRNASEYVSNRLYWLFGVNIMGGVIGSIGGFMAWAIFVRFLGITMGTVAYMIVAEIIGYHSTKLLKL